MDNGWITSNKTETDIGSGITIALSLRMWGSFLSCGQSNRTHVATAASPNYFALPDFLLLVFFLLLDDFVLLVLLELDELDELRRRLLLEIYTKMKPGVAVSKVVITSKYKAVATQSYRRLRERLRRLRLLLNSQYSASSWSTLLSALLITFLHPSSSTMS